MRLSNIKERAMQGVFFLTALASIAAVVLICIFLFYNGVPAMAEIGFFNFIGGTEWAPTNVPASYGIFTMIIGSIYVTAGCCNRCADRNFNSGFPCSFLSETVI